MYLVSVASISPLLGSIAFNLMCRIGMIFRGNSDFLSQSESATCVGMSDEMVQLSMLLVSYPLHVAMNGCLIDIGIVSFREFLQEHVSSHGDSSCLVVSTSTS